MTAHSVDWRTRWGMSWLTKVKNQDGGDCYLFGAVGLVETMLRIEHSLWSLRSEGDAGDSISMYFGTHDQTHGGNPQHVLNWIMQNGIADPGAWETRLVGAQDVNLVVPDSQVPGGALVEAVQVAMPTADRPGRIAKLDGWLSIFGSAAHPLHHKMKQWIDAAGPIVQCFACCNDFQDPDAYPNSWVNGVYVCSMDPQNLASATGHCIIIVGYDDSKHAWLLRNSWGTGWGMGGYAWFGYGQGVHGLENQAPCAIRGDRTNPDPWSKRRLHNGNFYEDGDGPHHQDFEVWAPGPGNVVLQYTRNGQTLAWSSAPNLPKNDCANVPSATSSTYFRNFEVVYQSTAKQLRHYLFDRLNSTWIDGGLFGPTDTDGIPGFIQINVGAPGNFEVVVRRSTGVLENWWRNNIGSTGLWALKATFGANVLHSGATLIERWAKNGAPNVGLPAGLDVVCVNTDNTMQRWWRDDPHTQHWVACETFGTAIDSPPVMIRSMFVASNETEPGNYELCVAVNGKIQHWCRLGNPEPTATATTADWLLSATFGANVQQVLGMIQSSFGFNLELIALLTTGKLQHFWRDSKTAAWHADPATI